MNPVTRILRTIGQVLAAAVIVLPAVVALLGTVGITVDGVGLAAVLAAAIVLVTTMQNALEQAGLIPEIGGPRLKTGKAIHAAPLYTHADVVQLASANTDGDTRERLLEALELYRTQCDRLVADGLLGPAPKEG